MIEKKALHALENYVNVVFIDDFYYILK